MLKEDMFMCCACLGPQKGEPHCPCTMVSMGWRRKEDYEPTAEEKQAQYEAFKKALAPFGFK